MRGITIFVAALAACSPASIDPTPPDINAVVSTRCSPCHRDGGIERPLVDGLGPWMVARVLDGSMPPGLPSRATPLLRDDPRLTPAEVLAFQQWRAAGYAPPLQAASTPSSSCTRPLLMAEAYTPPAPLPGGGADEYRCFLLPLGGLGGKTIRSFSWAVGQPEEMHHIVAVVVDAIGVARYSNLPQGWSCPQGLEVAAVASLGSGGTHDTRPKDFGPGAGVAVPSGGGIVVQMHYLLGRGLPDRSGVCLDLVDSLPLSVQDLVVSAPAELPPPQGVSLDPTSPLSRDYALSRPFDGWTAQQIRDNDDKLLADCGYTLGSYYAAQLSGGRIVSRCRKRVGVAGEIRNVHLHAHTYAVGGTLRLLRGDGTSTQLLDYSSPKYLWSWETIWGLQQGVEVAPDDQVEVTCEWDNSVANQWSLQYGPSLTGSPAADPVTPAYVPGIGSRAGEMCDGTVSIAVLH